jgi:S-DNA-T family DNA segregation ATPase FtsK/SpoIIIE
MEFISVNMAEAEEETVTNKFKSARNEFRKSKKKNEEIDLEIEDVEDIKKERSKASNEKEESVEESPAPKKKKKVPKEKVNPFQPVINFVKDERLPRVIGLCLILSSVYLLVAFTSFLFTWKTDQDKVMGSWWQLFFASEDVKVDNWLGKVGAVVSHLFIHKGFGVASYFFVVFSFLAGFRVLSKHRCFRSGVFSNARYL